MASSEATAASMTAESQCKVPATNQAAGAVRSHAAVSEESEDHDEQLSTKRRKIDAPAPVSSDSSEEGPKQAKSKGGAEMDVDADANKSVTDPVEDSPSVRPFDDVWNELTYDQPKVYAGLSNLLDMTVEHWEELMESCPEYAWDHWKHFISKWYCVRMGKSIWLSWTDISYSQEQWRASQTGAAAAAGADLEPCFTYDSVHVYIDKNDVDRKEATGLLMSLMKLIEASCKSSTTTKNKTMTVKSSTFLREILLQSTMDCDKLCLQNCTIGNDAQISRWLATRSSIFFRDCCFEQQGDGAGDSSDDDDDDDGSTNNVNASDKQSAAVMVRNLPGSCKSDDAASSIFQSISDNASSLEHLAIWSPKGLLDHEKIPFLTYAIKKCTNLKKLEICDYDNTMSQKSWNAIVDATTKCKVLEKICFRGYRPTPSHRRQNNNGDAGRASQNADNADGRGTTARDEGEWLRGLCKLIESSHDVSKRLFSITYHFTTTEGHSAPAFRDQNATARGSDEFTLAERKLNTKQLWSSMQHSAAISHLDLNWNEFDDPETLGKLTQRMDMNRLHNISEVVALDAARTDNMALLGHLLCHSSVSNNPEIMLHIISLANLMIKDCWELGKAS